MFVCFSRDFHSIETRLNGLEFLVVGELEKTKREIAEAVESMKGHVGFVFNEKTTAAVISDAENVKEMGPVMEMAKKFGIQVVRVDFLDAVKTTDPFPLINDMNISPWECKDVS